MAVDYTYNKLMHHGRLGNQLWQIASTYGRARKDGAQALFNPKWDYRRFFSVPDELFGKPRHNVVDFSRPVDGYVDYMQRIEEFAEVEQDVRDMFAPSAEAVAGINDRWPDLYGSHKKIAVHIRRGDYLNHTELFPPPTDVYYREGINQSLRELGVQDGMSEAEAAETAKILIFSDDIPWCKDKFSEHFTFIEGVARPVEVRHRMGLPEDQFDMFLMADCDRHVIANSSYSWWGAFLSEKDPGPFFPSVWYGPGIPEYPVWRKILPSNWRELSC